MNALQLTCLPLPQALTTHQAPEREASCAWYAGTSSGPCPWSGTAVAQGPTKSVRPVRDAGGFPSPGFHHRWPAARDRHRAEAPQLSRPPRSPSGRILPVSRAARGASADAVRSSGVSHSASLAGCRDSHSLRHNLRCGVRPGVSVRGFRTGTSPVQSPSDPVPVSGIIGLTRCSLAKLVALADSSCSGMFACFEFRPTAGSVSPTQCAQDINARVQRMCLSQACLSSGNKLRSVTFAWKIGIDCE